MNSKEAERKALLTRIDELVANDSAVYLINHYLERLPALDKQDWPETQGML